MSKLWRHVYVCGGNFVKESWQQSFIHSIWIRLEKNVSRADDDLNQLQLHYYTSSHVWLIWIWVLYCLVKATINERVLKTVGWYFVRLNLQTNGCHEMVLHLIFTCHMDYKRFVPMIRLVHYSCYPKQFVLVSASPHHPHSCPQITYFSIWVSRWMADIHLYFYWASTAYLSWWFWARCKRSISLWSSPSTTIKYRNFTR